MKLIASIHESILFNVEQAQKKLKKTYATRKGKQTFEGMLTLKKVAGYASLKLLMGISGKDHTWIYKFIMFYRTKRS
jgi:hypothetical protein